MANRYTKVALKQGGLALASLLLGILFIIVGIVRLYDYRNHVVTEVRVTLDTNSPQRMYLDEGFDTLVASGTLTVNERNKAIPTENQGQGQYYHPSRPEWLDGAWSFPQTQLYWIEGLDPAVGVNFTGGPLDPSILPIQIAASDYVDGYRFSLYTLPCDVPFDEVLVGISVVLFVRAAVHAILFVHIWSKHSAMELYNSEKKVPKDTRLILRVVRARRYLTYILAIFCVVLTFLYLGSETCERDAPELFYSVFLFLLSLWLGMIVYGVVRVITAIFADSDPGPCPACDGRRSSTSILLPCEHDVKYCYEDAVDTLLNNPCPVCTRLVRDVKLVRRGRVSAVAMAMIALLQMFTPFFEAYWSLYTTQCFAQDPPYTQYTKGCLLGQFLAVLMIFNGFLGVLVADRHGRNVLVSRIYRLLNFGTLFYCTFQAMVFMAAMSGRFLRPLSKASVTELREEGVSFDQLREENYHFWSLLAGDCSLEGAGSITAEWYSCRPCDKTEPSSCRGELQFTENMRHTSRAALAYLADAVFAGVVIMLYRGLRRTNERVDRENRATAQMEFKQMLIEEEDITEDTDPKGLAAIEADLARASELRGWRLVRQTLRDVIRGLCSKFVVHHGRKAFVESQDKDDDAKGSSSARLGVPANAYDESSSSSSDSDDFAVKADAPESLRQRRKRKSRKSAATVNQKKPREFSAVNASNIETQTRGYAVPARSTWESRLKSDERFHPLTLSPEDRYELFKEYQREETARKNHKGRWD